MISFFSILFNPFSLRKFEKTESVLLEVLIIPQTLNINNWRTTSERYIILDTIKKLMKYSFKNACVKAIFFSPFLRYCSSKIQSGTKCLRQALVCQFQFLFLKILLLVLTNFSFWEHKWALHFNSMKYLDLLDIS